MSAGPKARSATPLFTDPGWGFTTLDRTYKAIEVYRRENDWRPYYYRSGDLVELTSIGVSFPFDAVYRRIPL